MIVNDILNLSAFQMYEALIKALLGLFVCLFVRLFASFLYYFLQIPQNGKHIQ